MFKSELYKHNGKIVLLLSQGGSQTEDKKAFTSWKGLHFHLEEESYTHSTSFLQADSMLLWAHYMQPLWATVINTNSYDAWHEPQKNAALQNVGKTWRKW